MIHLHPVRTIESRSSAQDEVSGGLQLVTTAAAARGRLSVRLSSTTASTLKRRPQESTAETKSNDQRWSGSIAIGARVPVARLRPRRRRPDRPSSLSIGLQARFVATMSEVALVRAADEVEEQLPACLGEDRGIEGFTGAACVSEPRRLDNGGGCRCCDTRGGVKGRAISRISTVCAAEARNADGSADQDPSFGSSSHRPVTAGCTGAAGYEGRIDRDRGCRGLTDQAVWGGCARVGAGWNHRRRSVWRGGDGRQAGAIVIGGGTQIGRAGPETVSACGSRRRQRHRCRGRRRMFSSATSKSRHRRPCARSAGSGRRRRSPPPSACMTPLATRCWPRWSPHPSAALRASPHHTGLVAQMARGIHLVNPAW